MTYWVLPCDTLLRSKPIPPGGYRMMKNPKNFDFDKYRVIGRNKFDDILTVGDLGKPDRISTWIPKDDKEKDG